MTDEQILAALTIPGLNMEVSLEPRELPILLDGIRSIIDHVAGRLSILEIAMDGVSQEMIDGGWNARSLSRYAKSLEDKLSVASTKNAQTMTLEEAWAAKNGKESWGHEPTAKGLFEDGWNASLAARRCRPTTPSPISDQAAGEREAFEATGLDLCASPEGNFGVWKLACAWQREQLTVSVPVNSEWIEAAKAAEKVIDILWVSHHANRADDALEKLRAVLSTAPTTGISAIGMLPDETLAEYQHRMLNLHAHTSPASPAASVPVPWENLPCYLIDKCEGQVISEEFLQRALSDMLADPQYSGAKPFELSQEFISAAKDGPDVMGFDANAPAPQSGECPDCKGTGYDGSGYARVCTTCKGDAIVPTPSNPIVSVLTRQKALDLAKVHRVKGNVANLHSYARALLAASMGGDRT